MRIDIDNITAIKQPTDGFDKTYTNNGQIDGAPLHMVIAVDWEGLAAMIGRQVMRNKTRKTRLASGHIRGWVKQ